MANLFIHQSSTFRGVPIAGVAENGDKFGTTVAAGDFDGQKGSDLGVGVPGENTGAGAVNVLHGSNSNRGLPGTDNQIWLQSTPGVQGAEEAGDAFGSSLASGDFNRDGKDDLAIGAPGEAIGSIANAGTVNVLHGSNNGLTATDDQLWHQNSPGILGVAETGDAFGSSLSSGDFNGDGKKDLAIGAPGEAIGSIANAGAVNVLHGSNSGLTATGNQLWHQNSPGIEGVAETGDAFGSSLASGDFNGDGKDDLAVGVSGEATGSIANAGAVNVLHGSNSGLTATDDQLWHQNSPGIEGVAETGDAFGSSLAVGDFNGDGKDDLAVGVSGEATGSIANAGAVNVLHGSNSGLTATDDQLWHQNSPGIEGVAETGDAFGSSLAVGDFNGDGKDDLAIGVPGEAIGPKSNAGAVNVLHGSNSGLTATGNQLWHQDTPGVLNVAQAGDAFGSSLTVGDFNHDGFDDLAIGIPDENLPLIADAGSTQILFGSSTGLMV